MIDLVIFDCDGVLVDSERLAVQIDVQVLARLGWNLTEDEVVRRFVGVSDAHFRTEVEAYLGRRLDDDWEAEFHPLYREAFQAELRPVPGIFEALDQITCQTCVASSGTHEKIRFTLGLTGLYSRFRGRIFSATEVERGKPAPDLFIHSAQRMCVLSAHCVVVEDSVPGVEAAQAAGMKVLAYGGSVTPREKLGDAGAIVFDHMHELPALLARVDSLPAARPRCQDLSRAG